MQSSFKLDVFQRCPCHKAGAKRLIVTVDHRHRRFCCQLADRVGTRDRNSADGLPFQIPYSQWTGETWHFFDEAAWILGKEPEFNEHGEVAP